MFSNRSLLAGATVLVFGASAALAQSDRMFPQSVDFDSVKRVEVKDASGAAVLSGSFDAPRADGSKTERHAMLAGTAANTSGRAELEVSQRSGASHREMEVSVDDLSPRTQYRLFVDEVEVATFTTDGGGDATVEFDDTPGR